LTIAPAAWRPPPRGEGKRGCVATSEAVLETTRSASRRAGPPWHPEPAAGSPPSGPKPRQRSPQAQHRAGCPLAPPSRLQVNSSLSTADLSQYLHAFHGRSRSTSCAARVAIPAHTPTLRASSRLPLSRQSRAMLIAARNSQDFACCSRATASARSAFLICSNDLAQMYPLHLDPILFLSTFR
jgi:hypothetical protein